MSALDDTRRKLAHLLVAVANNQVPTAEALDRLKRLDTGGDRDCGRAWHSLWHFLADEDVRAGALDYDRARRSELRAAAVALGVEGDSEPAG